MTCTMRINVVGKPEQIVSLSVGETVKRIRLVRSIEQRPAVLFVFWRPRNKLNAKIRVA
jgi:hypothetical protein